MQKLFVTAVLIIATASAALGAATTSRSAADLTPPVSSSSSVVATMKNGGDGSALFQSFAERIRGLKAYLYDSSLTTFHHGKAVKETGRLYYKHPNLVRFEAKSAGFRSGSIVVRQPDGTVKGKMGGIFGLKMSLSPQSKLLMTANGYNILESDLSNLLAGASKGQNKYLATLSPVSYAGVPKAQILEILDSNGQVAHRIILDDRDKLPVEWSIFKDNKLFSVAQFSEIQVKPDMTDEMFVLESGADTKGMRAVELAEDEQNFTSKLKPGQLKLTLGSLLEFEQIIQDIRRTASSLKEDFAKGDKSTQMNPEAKGWSPVRARQLLAHVTMLDSLVTILDPIGSELEELDKKNSESPALNSQWRESVGSLDRSVTEVLASLDQESENSDVIVRESGNIAAQADKLESIMQKAFSLL